MMLNEQKISRNIRNDCSGMASILITMINDDRGYAYRSRIRNHITS